jgi:hypothetical protein
MSDFRSPKRTHEGPLRGALLTSNSGADRCRTTSGKPFEEAAGACYRTSTWRYTSGVSDPSPAMYKHIRTSPKAAVTLNSNGNR